MFRVLALSLFLAAIALPALAASPPAAPERIEDQLLAAANGFRADNRLAPLEADPTLTAAARDFAEYLARTGKFSHTADGRSPGDRARAAGYDYCELAENIAYEEDDAGFGADHLTHTFITGWENSPGHRRNLLDANVTQTGVGVARVLGRRGLQKYVAVQEFGRPSSDRYSFEVENGSVLEVGFTFDGVVRRVPPHATLRESTCATGEIRFERVGRGPQSYAAEPGARYVITDAPGGVRVEAPPARGRPEPD